MNLSQVLFERNSSRSNSIAYQEDERSITYGQLEHESRQLATWLRSQRLEPDEIVVVSIPDSINTVKAFLAVVLAGGIAAMANPRSQNLPMQSRIVLTEDNFPDTDNLDLAQHAYPRDQMDTVFMLWTSGTTGYSHPISHNALSACSQSESSGVQTLGITEEDRIYSTAKLYFAYGIIGTLFDVMWTGAQAYLDPGLSIPSRVRRIVDTYKPTKFFSVPVIYSQLSLDSKPWPLDMQCISAGDRLPEQIISRWYAMTGQRIHNSLGTTEALTAFSFNHQGNTAIGQAIPGYEMRISSERRLEVKCPGQEWMFTGDVCSVDTAGQYHHLGRYSDTIKINGIFVNPTEVEEVLIGHPSVEQAAVVSIPDSSGIEHIEAHVVLLPEQDILPADLRSWARGRLLRHACPTVIHIVTELPRTATGKIQRFKLRLSNSQ